MSNLSTLLVALATAVATAGAKPASGRPGQSTLSLRDAEEQPVFPQGTRRELEEIGGLRSRSYGWIFCDEGAQFNPGYFFSGYISLSGLKRACTVPGAARELEGTAISRADSSLPRWWSFDPGYTRIIFRQSSLPMLLFQISCQGSWRGA